MILRLGLKMKPSWSKACNFSRRRRCRCRLVQDELEENAMAPCMGMSSAHLAKGFVAKIATQKTHILRELPGSTRTCKDKSGNPLHRHARTKAAIRCTDMQRQKRQSATPTCKDKSGNPLHRHARTKAAIRYTDMERHKRQSATPTCRAAS